MLRESATYSFVLFSTRFGEWRAVTLRNQWSRLHWPFNIAAVGEPTLTVVVPFRDRSELLSKLVGSIDDAIADAGAHEQVAIILVDDRSEEPLKPPPIRNCSVVRNNGAGPSAARNTGANAATSKWVLFTDSDCVVDRSWIATALQLAEDSSQSVYQGDPTRYTRTTRWGELEEALYSHMYASYLRDDERRTSMLDSRNLMIGRDVLLGIGGFDGQHAQALAESRQLALRLQEAGHNFAFSRELRILHTAPRSLEHEMRTKFRHGRGRAEVWSVEPDLQSLLSRYFEQPIASGLDATYVVPVHLAFISGYSEARYRDRATLPARVAELLAERGNDRWLLEDSAQRLLSLD